MRCKTVKSWLYKNKKDQLFELVFYFDIKDEQQGEGGTLLSVSA